ncbi:MAG: neutral/alkaline non-lysosomal ceramidase N-terminal domain-containing protein [Planctomycetota bacterium]|nr:neutral/alkaline non-lysosomal ceramidase N-terminal domain-containing protein [Planctomycetaceae bacterium]MDQ3329439.1 neutral/alkaline non-lysosomal ceramidase N-terminal domain-containing protein [Planctomycetota bacterium]
MTRRLLVCLCWLALSPSVAAEPLSVGIGVAEITPPLGYPMSGYFYERGATGTLDPLLAKAIVFQQGDVKAALVVGDIIGIDRQLAEAIRMRIEEQTGIPAANVIVSATHSHTGPNYRTDLAKSMSRDEDVPLAENDRLRYIPQLIGQFATAVANADAALKPMNVQAGSGHEDGVSFNRRFVLKDGTVRTWAKLSDEDVVEAAGPIDPEIGLITFTTGDGEKPSAAIVNFALHCDTVGGTQYSADYPGHIERVLRKDLGSGFTSIFATGPCGDINHADPTGKPRRSAAEIGERIAVAAAKALPDLKPVRPSLAAKRAIVDVPLQTFSDEDLAWAEDLIARDRQGEKFPTTIQAKAYKIRRLQRLRSGQADLGRETDDVTESEDGARDSLPAEVQVIRLGDDTALVALPGEIFVELGLAIKQASPFEHTFVIELANDSPAYVPTRKALEQGGYEANNSLYAAGGGELLVETAIRMLKELSAE